jgi:phytoene dehydrogenase-like protein
MSPDAPVAIVGGGVAGLACALHLHAAGVPVRVLEAADAVGGRMRSDLVDGYRIDRGFQVLLTAYPEVRALLDLGALRLGAFGPGARLRIAGGFVDVLDPLRRPASLLRQLASRALPLRDQLRLARLRWAATRGSLDDLYARPAQSAQARLRALGFSDAAVERFFRPFFAGVFLERELASSSRLLEFAFRHFALGAAALPADGIEAVPRQLAARLPPGTITTGACVDAVEPDAVCVDGARVPAAAVVIATDGAAAHLLAPELPPRAHHGTACLSFAAERDPVGVPLLVLDAARSGPVNHLCVPSAVAPSYAPPGRALASASVVGVPSGSAAELERAARAQLRGWFGAEVESWRLLRIDRIPRALPSQSPGELEPVQRPVQLRPRLFVCGDHRDMGSLHGALHSGRRAAVAVRAALGVGALPSPASRAPS